MKFGVREICNVVLRAKNRMTVGNKIFYKNEPVIYFDTLKTSSMEGAATTVYAQGGRGNARLVAWEGERTITFTMEDALISPEGFMILSGAGLVDATASKPVYQHMTETVDGSDIEVASDGTVNIPIGDVMKGIKPFLPNSRTDNWDGNFAYVMFMRDGVIITEPYIPEHPVSGEDLNLNEEGTKYILQVKGHDCYDELHDDTAYYNVG